MLRPVDFRPDFRFGSGFTGRFMFGCRVRNLSPFSWRLRRAFRLGVASRLRLGVATRLEVAKETVLDVRGEFVHGLPAHRSGNELCRHSFLLRATKKNPLLHPQPAGRRRHPPARQACAGRFWTNREPLPSVHRVLDVLEGAKQLLIDATVGHQEWFDLPD